MFRGLLLVLGIFSVSQIIYSQDTLSPQYSFKWNNGFRLERSDNLFSLSFGGQIMTDHAHFFQNSALDKNYGVLENKSGTEITSARMYFSGDVYENIQFKFQVEFAGQKVDLKDVYIGITDIPVVGTLRVGHLHEPLRLSALTSGKYITFMDRGANSHFSTARSTGAVLFNDFFMDRFSVQIGAFRNQNNSSMAFLKHDGHALTGRMTGLPIRNNDKTHLLHLGVAYSFRKPQSGEYKVSISPGSRLAHKYVQTGIMEEVNHISLANFETAYLHGPFSVQAEFLGASVNTQRDDYRFFNYYSEFSYFLTGESKNYKSSYEGFGRVKPKKNFGGKERGIGAWEVAAKYSQTDLNDGDIFGGKEKQIAFGLNWYLNPVTRFIFNYVHASFENLGNLDLVQARFQIDF